MTHWIRRRSSREVKSATRKEGQVLFYSLSFHSLNSLVHLSWYLTLILMSFVFNSDFGPIVKIGLFSSLSLSHSFPSHLLSPSLKRSECQERKRVVFAEIKLRRKKDQMTLFSLSLVRCSVSLTDMDFSSWNQVVSLRLQPSFDWSCNFSLLLHLPPLSFSSSPLLCLSMWKRIKEPRIHWSVYSLSSTARTLSS